MVGSRHFRSTLIVCDYFPFIVEFSYTTVYLTCHIKDASYELAERKRTSYAWGTELNLLNIRGPNDVNTKNYLI